LHRGSKLRCRGPGFSASASIGRMLRSAAQRVLHQPGLLQAACFSSAKLPEDYSIVISGTAEVGKHVDTPEKEIGYCAGVPMETFNRKVHFACSSNTRAAHALPAQATMARSDSFVLAGSHLLTSTCSRPARTGKYNLQQQGAPLEDLLRNAGKVGLRTCRGCPAATYNHRSHCSCPGHCHD